MFEKTRTVVAFMGEVFRPQPSVENPPVSQSQVRMLAVYAGVLACLGLALFFTPRITQNTAAPQVARATHAEGLRNITDVALRSPAPAAPTRPEIAVAPAPVPSAAISSTEQAETAFQIPAKYVNADGMVDSRTVRAYFIDGGIGAVDAPVLGAVAPASSYANAERYIVQPGDNLAYIALLHYGDPTQFDRIFAANDDQLSAPEKIKVGQILTIPR